MNLKIEISRSGGALNTYGGKVVRTIVDEHAIDLNCVKRNR